MKISQFVHRFLFFANVDVENSVENVYNSVYTPVGTRIWRMLSMRKSVLITGGSRGIGGATVRHFAQKGWNVALHYHQSKEQAQQLAEELGDCVHLVQGDLRNSSDVNRLVGEAIRLLGGLDALVCNAGIAQPVGLLSDLSDEGWRQIMSTNLDGTFYALRGCIPHFVRQQSGAIVTLSSMWGVTGGSCEAAYSASKAGIIGLTRALAKELGPSHIRVNCVAPGVIQTEMNGNLDGETLQSLAEETPLGRIGTPGEVAEAIYFLCAEGSAFVTGQVLQVNGGILI